MILSATPTLEGKTIREYRGSIVVGEAILGANIFKDLFAGIRDIIGGRSAPTKELARAREIAFEELKERPGAGGQRRGGHRHRLRGGGPEWQHADGQQQAPPW
jgi:uncharacterized protein YbjQ (UPF0145 family)